MWVEHSRGQGGGDWWFEALIAFLGLVFAGIGAWFTYVQIRNARRAEVLEIISYGYRGEVAQARSKAGAYFEPSVEWSIVAKAVKEPEEAQGVGEGNLVRQLQEEMSSPGDLKDRPNRISALDNLYNVLWYFNQVSAFRRSITRHLFGRASALELLDDSIGPLVMTYLRYYGPAKDPSSDSDFAVVGNIDTPELTSGNGHEGLFDLARVLGKKNDWKWRRRTAAVSVPVHDAT